MAVPLGSIFANAAVSQLVGMVLSNFFGRFGTHSANSATLEGFLSCMSRDFSNRVETVIRGAFAEQNLMAMKADVIGAATHFRAYITTQGAATTNLDEAFNTIVSARSKLIVTVQRIVAWDSRTAWDIVDPQQRGVVLLQQNRELESAIAALQAVASLDLLILAKRIEVIPALAQEMRDRIGEYTELAQNLKTAYTVHQSLRQWLKVDEGRVVLEGGLRHMQMKATHYKDGNPVSSQTKLLISSDGNFNKRCFTDMERAIMSDETFFNAANAHLSTNPGNLAEAILTWEAVRAQFQ